MTSSGSVEFDRLRAKLIADTDLRREVEFAFSSLLTAANPSDRGLRFLFGNGAEWIIAAAAWSAGVLTAPQGHNVNGFDLGDLLDKAKGLWSVKASASPGSSQIRLKNFMGGGTDAVWTEPTLFVSPYLEGAVFVDPRLHTEVQSQVKNSGDALVLGAGVVRVFAKGHPTNHVRFEVARNQGEAKGDPYAFIKSVITPDHFPRLSKPFLASSPPTTSSRVDEINRLVQLRDDGVLTDEQLSKAIEQTLR